MNLHLQKDDDPSRGFWVEGRVYAVSTRKEDKARGWDECDYNAVRVLWYEQDLALPDRWAIEVYQTSNTLSPWVSSARVLSWPSTWPLACCASLDVPVVGRTQSMAVNCIWIAMHRITHFR